MNHKIKSSRRRVATFLLLPSLLFAVDTKARGATVQQGSPVSSLNLQVAFHNYDVRFLGLAQNQTAFFTTEEEENPNQGFIVRWNTEKGRVDKEIPLSKWLSAFNMVLSLDGKRIVTDNDHTSLSFPHAKGYRITVLNSSTLQAQWTRPVGKYENSGTFIPLLGDSRRMIVGIQKMIPIKGTKDNAYFGPIQFQFTDPSNGHVDKKMDYEHAGGVSTATLSPTQRYLVCAFTVDEENTLDEHLEREGTVDILDYKTGKILWHLEGTDKQPVGDPLFFISPTRFVSSDTLFDIKTHKAQHWSAVTPTRKCLAAVPNHPSHALFLTPHGLQLRNWQKNKTLVSWPGIKNMGRIMFSPDLGMFSFKRGSIIQFWKFDPKWLR